MIYQSKKVRRINANDESEFLAAFHSKIPVILEGLLDSDPLSIEEIEAMFGEFNVEIMKEYSSHFLEENTFLQDKKIITLAEYISYVKKNPDTQLCVREYNTHEKIIKYLGIPELVSRNFPDEITSNVFIANSGNKAQLHFDGDHRHVILYQLSGRKKGVIFEPKNGNGLFPVLNQSWIDIESFNDKQLDYFVAMNDGYIADLEPGDALYFPMMMWHHFSYVDTGVSVNFRFGRKRNNDLLYRYVHADKFLQNLAWHLDFDEQAIIDSTLVMNEITAILERFYESPVKKRNDMRSLMKNLCSKFNIFEEQPIFTIKENDIIKSSEALNAISSQPYHFHNWTKYIGADDMLKTFANLARS